MKIYFVSVAAGILAGVLYGVIGVRSPAPPLVALAGLLGMLIGEQVVPVARRVSRSEPVTAAWFTSECMSKITGAPSKEPPGDTPTPGR